MAGIVYHIERATLGGVHGAETVMWRDRAVPALIVPGHEVGAGRNRRIGCGLSGMQSRRMEWGRVRDSPRLLNERQDMFYCLTVTR